MRLLAAIILQCCALFFAWLNSPATLILAGMCAAGALVLRARFHLKREDLMKVDAFAWMTAKTMPAQTRLRAQLHSTTGRCLDFGRQNEDSRDRGCDQESSMRNTKYAREIVSAGSDDFRIERIFVKGERREEIRFSWWPDGKFKPRPLDVTEDELLPLLRAAIVAGVFTDQFLIDLKTALDRPRAL